MIQYWHEKHRELRRQRDEEGFNGFTLIELLIVIVVLGILAATVIFALGGVTGQSAQAACNSDAKTTEVAVQAYIASPDNVPPGSAIANAQPTSMDNLYHAPFTTNGAAAANGNGDTFETVQNNKAFTISLGSATDSTKPGDSVWVTVGTNNPGLYDSSATGASNPCSAAS